MASIAIIGSGFVGQANGKVLASQGHNVFFADIDKEKIAKLKQENYQALTPEELAKERHIDIFFIAVQTPTINGRVQLNFIQQAAQHLGSLLAYMDAYPIVVTKSTVPPGTISRLIIPTLENFSGKKAGYDFGVAMEPEYLRERVAFEDARSPRIILIGSSDKHSGHIIEWLRAPFKCPIVHVSIEEAEFQKYVHNLWNANKISFFNEMRTICEKTAIDCDKVFPAVTQSAEGFWNPMYGLKDMGPFGGTCLPKDTSGFLTWAKDTLHINMPLLEATINVNEALIKKQQLKNPALFIAENPEDNPPLFKKAEEKPV